MAENFLFMCPSYTLIIRESQTIYDITYNSLLMLPLFSDYDNALTYVERMEIGSECLIFQLDGPDEVRAFVRNPPIKYGRRKPDLVVVDPMAGETGPPKRVYRKDQVLNAIIDDDQEPGGESGE